METAWHRLIEWVPQLIAGQFFFVVLIYFTLMRRRLQREFPYYALFLTSFIFFLTVKTIETAELLPIPGNHILYTRMFVLFSIGLPSLTAAAALHSGFRLNRKHVLAYYLVGLCFGALYVINMDQHWHKWYGSGTWIATDPLLSQIWRIPFPYTQIIAVTCLLILPSLFILYRCPRGRGSLMISGILMFGFFMVIGSALEQWWIYYTGSIVSALVWFSAICRDIRKLRGKSYLLKEEFQLLLQTGESETDPKLDQLLRELEALSEGNLDVYKLKVREILNMLTDTTIEAGGDSKLLLEQKPPQHTSCR